MPGERPPTLGAVRALVTGAAGFAGAHLVDHLLRSGDDVVGIDRSDADLRSWDDVATTVAAANPEVIFHLAGAADVGASWQHPRATFEANATGTLHVLEAARLASVRRVIVVSSADVYGTVDAGTLPLDEDSPVRPASPYAASKLAAEQLATQAWLGYGIETIRVRAFNHLGPGQRSDFVAPAIAMAIAENERSGVRSIPIGNLSARRDFTDVRDVARAYRLLAVDGEPGEAYCLCSGEALAVSDLAERLLGMSTAEMSLTPDPNRQRPVDIPVLVGSHAKLTAATGWEPALSIDTTLSDLLADCRRRVLVPTRGATS